MAVLRSSTRSSWSHAASGGVSLRLLLGVFCPLHILGFCILTGLSVASFPASYDFRHQWISLLATPEQNPSGYLFMSLGFVWAAAGQWMIAGYLLRKTGRGIKGNLGVALMYLGISGVLLLAAEASCFPALGLSRGGHWPIAIVALAGLTLGLIFFWAPGRSRGQRWKRWHFWLCGLFLCAPALGSGLSELMLQIGLVDGFLFSHAFWEWASVFGITLGQYLTVWEVSQSARKSLRVVPALESRVLSFDQARRAAA